MLYYVVSLLRLVCLCTLQYRVLIHSQIYCDGPILQAVQDAHLFHDSKYFVDMPLRQDPGDTHGLLTYSHIYSHYPSRFPRTGRKGEEQKHSFKVCQRTFRRAWT